MKILIVNDSNIWAIGQLSRVIENFNQHLDIKQIEVHPKELRNDRETNIEKFAKAINDFQPDVIHFQYWFLAHELGNLPICKNIKKILTHHNQKNLLTHDWKHLEKIIVHTQKAKKTLEEAGYWNVEVIQHGIDIEKFKFKEELENDNRLLGYVGRIVPWKGLVDILKVAKEVDSEVVMMGRIDKADYWQKCLEHELQMDIRFQTPDEEQVSVYHEMSCYIGNSCDNIEEGTLGFLEAMACGIPVITTPSGEAMDIIEDGVNGILVEYENYESLKEGVMKFLKMTAEEKNKMRQKAWDTVRHMSQEVMARKYEMLYYQTLYKKDLISVIIPTCGRADTITQVLDGYAKQTYSPIELVVVIDDIDIDDYLDILLKFQKENNIPIKFLSTGNDGYGLAQARNMGIFASSGHYLIFNDDRFVPDMTAVEFFVNNLKQIKEPSVTWGDKGAGKRDFIENFFAIRKIDIVNAGMFNERINEYGGQSQEFRQRLRNLGYKLHFEPDALAKAIFGTKSKTKRRYELFRTKTKLWLLNK